MKKLLIILSAFVLFACNNRPEEPEEQFFEITVTDLENNQQRVDLESSHSGNPQEVNVRMYFDEAEDTNYEVIYWNGAGEPPNTTTLNPWEYNPEANSVTYYGFVRGNDVTVYAEPVTKEK